MKALLLSVFSCFVLAVSAQDSITHSEGLQFSYHPYDLFSGAHYSVENNRKEHQFLLQVGVMRTFFQQCIYPQIGYQFAYHLVDRKTIRTGLLARPVVSFLNVNRAAKHGASFFEEAFLGAFIGAGNNYRVRLSAGFGPCLEQKWSEPESTFVSWFSWNYFGELSFSYAF